MKACRKLNEAKKHEGAMSAFVPVQLLIVLILFCRDYHAV